MRINIDPIPCPRPRVRAFKSRGGKMIANAYYPAAYKQWREKFGELLPLELTTSPFHTPVEVHLFFVVKRPKTTKLLTPKGDIDNYVKSVLDGLTDIGAWDDDTLVEALIARKRFTREGEEPHITIEITQ